MTLIMNQWIPCRSDYLMSFTFKKVASIYIYMHTHIYLNFDDTSLYFDIRLKSGQIEE